MEELKTYHVTYFIDGDETESVFIAQSEDETVRMLEKDYNMFGIKIKIEEIKEVRNKRIVVNKGLNNKNHLQNRKVIFVGFFTIYLVFMNKNISK